MSRHIIGLFVFIGATAFAQPAAMSVDSEPLSTEWKTTLERADIECSTSPGKGICRGLRRFNSLLVECTGSGCYDLWDAQMRLSRQLTRFYYNEVGLGDTVSGQIGDYSRQLARTLCRVQVTGSPDYVSRLAIHYNRLLVVLKELQEGAELKSPYSCKFNVE